MRYTWETPSLDQATELAALGFSQDNSPGLREDVRNHLEGADACLCIYDAKCLVGYMLFQLPEHINHYDEKWNLGYIIMPPQVKHIVYIAGTLVHPEYQGKGLKAEATRMAMDKFMDRTYFAGRTQSPIVWSSVTRLASVVYPHPNATKPSSQMLSALDALVAYLKMKSAIEPGFYGGPLYGQKPLHRNEGIQAWWDSLIDFQRGDALLYIAQR
jgi:ribosomal protein S18 acetylase RimI-like enzyme